MPFTTFSWSAIRDRLDARLERKDYWEPEELLDAFNEGLRVWNLLTGMWRRRTTMLTVANQYEYALPATLLYRTRLTIDDLPIVPTSREDLNKIRPDWRSETTTSGRPVADRVTAWAPISLQLIYIWPADAVAGHTLTVDGISDTPVLANDGDTVDVTEDQLTAFLGYALHALTFKKGGTAFTSTMPLFQTFLQLAGEENEIIKAGAMFRRFTGLDRRDLKMMSVPALPIGGA